METILNFLSSLSVLGFLLAAAVVAFAVGGPIMGLAVLIVPSLFIIAFK